MVHWFWLFSLLFPPPSLGAPTKDKVIRICLTRSVLDYGNHLKKLGSPNPALNLLTKVAQELHYDLTFEYLEPNRCLKYTKEGEFEGLYPTSARFEDQSFLNFPKTTTGALDLAVSLHTATWNVYTLKTPTQKSPAKSIKDIPGLIGIPFGAGTRLFLPKEGVTLDESTKTPEDLLRQLLTKRVSAIVLNTYEFSKAKTAFEKTATDDIQLQLTVKEEPIYFVFTTRFATKHPTLTKKFYALIASEKMKSPYRKELEALKKALE